MGEFNFSGGCGANLPFLKTCVEGSLCVNCVEAWSCQIKYEDLLKENISLNDSYRLVSSVEANTEIENVKLKAENTELKKLKTVDLNLVDALIISKLEYEIKDLKIKNQLIGIKNDILLGD